MMLYNTSEPAHYAPCQKSMTKPQNTKKDFKAYHHGLLVKITQKGGRQRTSPPWEAHIYLKGEKHQLIDFFRLVSKLNHYNKLKIIFIFPFLRKKVTWLSHHHINRLGP